MGAQYCTYCVNGWISPDHTCSQKKPVSAETCAHGWASIHPVSAFHTILQAQPELMRRGSKILLKNQPGEKGSQGNDGLPHQYNLPAKRFICHSALICFQSLRKGRTAPFTNLSLAITDIVILMAITFRITWSQWPFTFFPQSLKRDEPRGYFHGKETKEWNKVEKP